MRSAPRGKRVETKIATAKANSRFLSPRPKKKLGRHARNDRVSREVLNTPVRLPRTQVTESKTNPGKLP
jgi:hypothetical protein